MSASVLDWRRAAPGAMFEHLLDLHDQLALTAQLLEDRDRYYALATPASESCVARARALLCKPPRAPAPSY
jgi:hypothetical protein